MTELNLSQQNSDQFFDQLPKDFWFEGLRIMARSIKFDGSYYSGGDRGQWIATKETFLSEINGKPHDPYSTLGAFRNEQVLAFDWNNTAEYSLCDGVEDIVEAIHWELSRHLYALTSPAETIKTWPSFWGPVPTVEHCEALLPVLKTPGDLADYLFGLP